MLRVSQAFRFIAPYPAIPKILAPCSLSHHIVATKAPGTAFAYGGKVQGRAEWRT